MQFQHITGDFRQMTEEDQKQTTIRCGVIDPVAVFRSLFNYSPKTEDVTKTKAAIDATLPYMTRCQHDLLVAEFGQDETTLADTVTPTDTLFENPPAANVKKLEKALEQIRKRIQ